MPGSQHPPGPLGLLRGNRVNFRRFEARVPRASFPRILATVVKIGFTRVAHGFSCLRGNCDGAWPSRAHARVQERPTGFRQT